MRDTTRQEAAAIKAACQNNRWLAGREVAISRADSAAEAALFVSSSRRLGEGIASGDVVLVQQVDLGDEWLALKRDGDSWFAFDSLSLAWASGDTERFEDLLESMESATPDECRRLIYRPLPERAHGAMGIAAEPARERPAEREAR